MLLHLKYDFELVGDVIFPQMREKVLLRQQGSYILTVETGRQLLLSADSRAEASLQEELMNIQERWRLAVSRLNEQKKELTGLHKVTDRITFFIQTSLSYPSPFFTTKKGSAYDKGSLWNHQKRLFYGNVKLLILLQLAKTLDRLKCFVAFNVNVIPLDTSIDNICDVNNSDHTV